MRIRYKQTHCVCVVCGNPFIAFSARAKTCNEACRKRLSRQRQRELLAPQDAMHRVIADAPAAAMPGAARPRRVGPRDMPLSPIERFLRLAAPADRRAPAIQ